MQSTHYSLYLTWYLDILWRHSICSVEQMLSHLEINNTLASDRVSMWGFLRLMFPRRDASESRHHSKGNIKPFSHLPESAYTADHTQVRLDSGLLTLRRGGHGQNPRDRVWTPPRDWSVAWLRSRSVQSSSVEKTARSTVTRPLHPDVGHLARNPGWKSLSASAIFSSLYLSCRACLKRPQKAHPFRAETSSAGKFDKGCWSCPICFLHCEDGWTCNERKAHLVVCLSVAQQWWW